MSLLLAQERPRCLGRHRHAEHLHQLARQLCVRGTGDLQPITAPQARKNVYVDGIAASIASVIAMAGDTVYMPKNAMMMIHNPWGVVVGNAEHAETCGFPGQDPWGSCCRLYVEDRHQNVGGDPI